jgi:hypothetical protein
MASHPAGRPLPRILHGSAEPVFGVLPETVLANLRRPSSENALLWNLIYPRARPSLSLKNLLSLRPMWGTAVLEADDDALTPYFWGFAADGHRLPALAETLEAVDGAGPSTEVDLYLLGKRNLIVIEAKRGSGLGRCGRYEQGVCPHLNPGSEAEASCRYWDLPAARFDGPLSWTGPPVPGDRPACAVHYQLGRTLLVGRHLAQRLDRRLHLWLLAPSSAWSRLQSSWLDFAGAVRQPELWRRLRVLSWESIAQLPA